MHHGREAAETFRAMHHGPAPLVLPNAWDPVSARIIAEAGYPAIATSSGAVARVLGYDDGQLTPPAEMFEAVARIVPGGRRTGDGRHGGRVRAGPEGVRRAAAGDRRGRLQPGGLASSTCWWMSSSRRTTWAQYGRQRVPTWSSTPASTPSSRGGTVDDAIARGRAYRRAGADCVYPILAPLDVLKRLVDDIGGPLNAHAKPNGPTAGRADRPRRHPNLLRHQPAQPHQRHPSRGLADAALRLAHEERSCAEPGRDG